MFPNHSTSHKHYRRTNTLVDYFKYNFLTFFHYNHIIILIQYHSMDSSHHHPDSTPKLLAFFKACKSPDSSDVLGCKEAARHRQQLCDYCTSANPAHCPHLQSGKCHICPQQNLIWSTPHIISRNSVSKSTNKLWRWLLQLHVSPSLCVELECILTPLLILFTGNSSTSSINVIPGPIAPILLELWFANWGFRHTFPLKTK